MDRYACFMCTDPFANIMTAFVEVFGAVHRFFGRAKSYSRRDGDGEETKGCRAAFTE